MGAGYIYILTNPSMPDLIKIGLTYRRVEERLLELSGATGVPTRFAVEYYCLTSDVEEVEREIHNRYSSARRPSREFFAVPLAEAIVTADSLMRPLKPDRFCRVEPTITVEPEPPIPKDTIICSKCGQHLSVQRRFQRLVGRVQMSGRFRLRCPKCGNFVYT
jgi:hypothetical protein